MKERLRDFVVSISEFARLSHAERIRLFAWFTHYHLKQDRFKAAGIKACYSTLSMEPPVDIRSFLVQMESAKPKRVMRDERGWYLEHSTFEALTTKHGERAITVEVSRLLETLPSKVPDHAEREFLEEALVCYKRGAFRAAVVMTWNLAYWHVCQHILLHHLAAFNKSYESRYPGKWQKAKVQALDKFDDFSVDLQESEVLEIAKSAVILSNDKFKILHHALGKRNSAAHPSSIKIEQLQAESLIDDLIKNLVLTLPL